MHSGASTPRQEEVTQLYVFLLSYIPCHTSILHPPPTYQNQQTFPSQTTPQLQPINQISACLLTHLQEPPMNIISCNCAFFIYIYQLTGPATVTCSSIHRSTLTSVAHPSVQLSKQSPIHTENLILRHACAIAKNSEL